MIRRSWGLAARQPFFYNFALALNSIATGGRARILVHDGGPMNCRHARRLRPEEGLEHDGCNLPVVRDRPVPADAGIDGAAGQAAEGVTKMFAIFCGIVSALLLVYLAAAMLFPEWF